MENSGKIVRNTLALYIRMVLLTMISLFTYRVIFQCLGASDYGTYNVIAGFISLFGFVSGTMTNATQRFLAKELAMDDWQGVNRSFSLNFVIYVAISVLFIALAETIGFWFVTTQLNLDYSRMSEIVIVYETSVIIFLSGLITSPFMALLVADENITVYAWFSIVEGILKIIVASALFLFDGQKLVIYSVLLLCVSLIINSIYIGYCLFKYRMLKIKICKEVKEYKAIFSFINWNLIGAVAAIGKNQGINIIINIFFGTIINAARGIAFQLNVVISSFAQNFMRAIDPRIIKAYARRDYEEFIQMIHIASKTSFYLLMIIAVPFIANAEYILSLWLGELPEYTVVFASLALVDAMILSLTDSFLTAVQAIGKVRIYQLSVGILSLINLPCAYIGLKVYCDPILPCMVAIVLDLFITVGRIVNLKLLYDFSVLQYLRKIVIPAVLVLGIGSYAILSLLFQASNFYEFILNVIFDELILVILIYTIGINRIERRYISAVIRRKLDIL